MVRVNILALAGAFAVTSTAALAADFPGPPPMPPVMHVPVPVDNGGWYLRGDVGVGSQNFQSFDFVQTNAASGAVWPATWRIEQKDIKDTTILGGGIGYSWNNWLRMDFTGEYRGSSKFKAIGSYINFPNPALGRAADVYDGDHQALVFLANGYLDLGTWWCLTPFIGAGVGTAYHTTSALSDLGINSDGLGASAWGVTQTDHSQMNLAWAVHAGLSYTVSNNFKVEFSYRYLNMGNVNTSEVLCGAGGCGTGSGPRAYYTMTNFSSNDFRIGMRWMLQADTPQPVYAPPPPPMYSPPPPLMRKG